MDLFPPSSPINWDYPRLDYPASPSNQLLHTAVATLIDVEVGFIVVIRVCSARSLGERFQGQQNTKPITTTAVDVELITLVQFDAITQVQQDHYSLGLEVNVIAITTTTIIVKLRQLHGYLLLGPNKVSRCRVEVEDYLRKMLITALM